MKTYRIAAIPGDGIGTEVVDAGVEVLKTLAQREGTFTLTFDHFDGIVTLAKNRPFSVDFAPTSRAPSD
jgi:isocitrate/isopropylmalate dehydrogenase